MSKSDLIPFGTAVASDVLSAFQLPGGSTLTKFADVYVARKRKEAAELLIAEVSNGYHGKIEFGEHDVDPLIEITLRFSKAVADGAAKENLILLAQVIAGLKKKKAFNGDRFRKWCGILEQLTRSELLVIGLAYVAQQEVKSQPPGSANDFSTRLDAALERANFEKPERDSLYAAVSRHGLLLPASAWGGLVYLPSPWLEELGELAHLESIAG